MAADLREFSSIGEYLHAYGYAYIPPKGDGHPSKENDFEQPSSIYIQIQMDMGRMIQWGSSSIPFICTNITMCKFPLPRPDSIAVFKKRDYWPRTQGFSEDK